MDIKQLSSSIVGKDAIVETPYGERILTYCDYTASGRALDFIESYMATVKQTYANTHTKNSYMGMQTSHYLETAIDSIKRALNISDDYAIFFVGSGSTGAIQRLTQILGIYESPPTGKVRGQLSEKCKRALPVVFTGPYEHHSNILFWQEGLSEVVSVDLNEQGRIDLADLEKKVSDPKYHGRKKIGAFSAASNVTGIITPVAEVTAILHRHNCLVFFDYAASAPYVDMKLLHDDGTWLHGIYFSPHKYLGGPESTGILVMHKSIYDTSLAPTCPGGGTVRYVHREGYTFLEDIEARENGGTPAIVQIIRAAAAIAVKEQVGYDLIHTVEEGYVKKAFERLLKEPNVEIIGPQTPDNRLSILSFNIKFGKYYLHPGFVSVLLSDLFGIQIRAGCSCAGPYGHALLGIDDTKAETLKMLVEQGYEAIRPGWARLNFHYTLSEVEVDYILEAISFIAHYGLVFLSEYTLDTSHIVWQHKNYSHRLKAFDVSDLLDANQRVGRSHKRCQSEQLSACFNDYLTFAHLEKDRIKCDYQLRVYELEQDKTLTWFYV